MRKTEILEPSTNTHKITANDVVVENLTELGGMKLTVEGEGIVTHGEHGVIVTEGKNVIKLVQQEVNPITRALQNSFD